MERVTETGLVILVTLGFIGWLGGGRKWAFRTMLSASALAGLGFAGILLYGYVADNVAEHRTQKVHDCAIAKIAKAQCDSPPTIDFSKYEDNENSSSHGVWQDYVKRPSGKTSKPDVFDEAAKEQKKIVWDVCPPYGLADNPTLEQENAAVAAAEEECRGEIDPKQKSLHEQISQYRREHGIKEQATSAVRLDPKACATKVRTFYPGAYDDVDDATLTKKVLAKYPTYCDVTSSRPDFIPDLKGIR